MKVIILKGRHGGVFFFFRKIERATHACTSWNARVKARDHVLRNFFPCIEKSTKPSCSFLDWNDLSAEKYVHEKCQYFCNTTLGDQMKLGLNLLQAVKIADFKTYLVSVQKTNKRFENGLGQKRTKLFAKHFAKGHFRSGGKSLFFFK